MKRSYPDGVSQVFNGEVSGLVAGRDVHVHQVGGLDWWDMDLPQLLSDREVIKAQISRARRRCWVNIPTALSVLLIFLILGFGLTAMVTLPDVSTKLGGPGAGLPWKIFAGTLVCVLMLKAVGIWRARVERYELAAIRSASADLEAIEVVLRRRWGR